MRKTIILTVLMLAGLFCSEASANSAIYACGHIRRERAKAIPALKNSGYTTAIIFNVRVENDGTLTTDFDWDYQRPAEAGGIICRDGQYVFNQYQPEFAADMKSLLEAPTSISRLEFCIGGWGDPSYGNIRNLINSYGTGESSILYKNFKALLEAIPEVRVINNDQEQDYEVNAATSFHKMLAKIGYKTSIAPYTQKNFWQQLVANLNAEEEICDLVYLQTYGGGAYNNPADWKVFGDLPMYVGFDNEESDNLEAMTSRFINWRDNAGADGGFIWNYNNENRILNQWATAINRVFPPEEVVNPVATIYSQSNFAGLVSQLPEGEFTQGELSLFGIQAGLVSSLQLAEGFMLTIYSGDAFTGDSNTFTEDTSNVGLSWRGRTRSVKIEKIKSSVESFSPEMEGNAEIYDLQGRKIANPKATPKGIYIVKTPAGTNKIVR